MLRERTFSHINYDGTLQTNLIVVANGVVHELAGRRRDHVVLPQGQQRRVEG